MSEAARRAAERAARTSYGRLLALLARRSGDIAVAEDALADAFAAALRNWSETGVPDNPDAWLLTTARRVMGHSWARRETASANEAHLIMLDNERKAATSGPLGDARLELMFVCTHPAIAADTQAPLMLQTVLGLDAARIAACFLVSPAAMGQKLVRAKTKIRHAGIPFAIPDPYELNSRTGTVLSAIYAAYGTGWEDVLGADPRRKGLAEEALWLGSLVVELMPEDPEAMGLLSLMLHSEARRVARRDDKRRYVPLDQQDVTRWSQPMIQEAETLIRAASRHGQPGRFQTEAAIQSLHVEAHMTGRDLREPLAQLYNRLVTIAPSKGALVARAVAHAEAGAIEAAQAMIARIDAPSYQPLWASKARIDWLAGAHDDARHAAQRAAGLSDDPAVREFLLSGGLFCE